MKATRKQLIDFLHWYHEQPYEIRQQLMYPAIIDLYLKSINSAPGEARSASKNEAQRKVCDVCGSDDTMEIPHMGLNCNKCHPL